MSRSLRAILVVLAVNCAFLATQLYRESPVSAGDDDDDDGEQQEADLSGRVEALEATVTMLQGQLAALQASLPTAEEKEILDSLSIVFLEDGQGGMAKTIRFTGVNVQIVNGLGATNGDPDNHHAFEAGDIVKNGVGNLIVGYNEEGNESGDDRTGSHNIVLGLRNNYTSCAGIVAGRQCAMTAFAASVTGGNNNKASGIFSSVSGGEANTASGFESWAAGGNANVASGENAAISGGQFNRSTQSYSSVSGGKSNHASALWSTVSGGENNVAATDGAHVP